jgi:CRP-like cAMP-binding protein
MAGPPDKLALLRDHALFGQLPPRVIEHLGSYMRKRTLARGENIFSKGDLGSGLMGVLSGSVKISVPSADGRDIVLRIIHPGEIFGEIALLDGRPPTADATAMTDCQLMVIGRRRFHSISSHSARSDDADRRDSLLALALDHRAGPGRELSRSADPARQGAAAFGKGK